MQNLSCEQVIALLSFYIEKKLTANLMNEVEYHLNTCKKCKNKYFNMLKIFKNYDEINMKINESEDDKNSEYSIRQYQKFKENLSAYLDNELNENENIKIKKIAIINKDARAELENMLYFRYLLQYAFDITKNTLKKDYSAEIINTLYKKTLNEKKYNFNINYTLIICILIYLILFLKKLYY